VSASRKRSRSEPRAASPPDAPYRVRVVFERGATRDEEQGAESREPLHRRNAPVLRNAAVWRAMRGETSIKVADRKAR